jgi:hypothetical protein
MDAKALWPLLLISLAACPGVAAAFQNIRVDHVCIAQAGVVPPPILPIPVGCELIDCCPGCPPARSLDWRITTKTSTLEGAQLRFEGPAPEARTLKIDGNARLEGERIVLSRGSATIKGVPASTTGKPVVGLLSPIVGKNTASRLSPPGSDAAGVIDEITVEQLIGSIPVNTFRWRVVLSPCPAQKPVLRAAKDKLRIPNIPAGESVTVLMDARTGNTGNPTCIEDRKWNASGDTTFSNLNVHLLGTCNSEVAVFGRQTAMLLESMTTTWTPGLGDVYPTRPLSAPTPVPVNVWIANSDLTCNTNSAPAEHLANAGVLYTNNKVGVVFQPSCQVVTGDANAMAAIASGIGTPDTTGAVACDNLTAVQTSTKYVSNQLNVYYVSGNFPGRNCAIRTNPADTRPGDGNITYIGSGPDNPPNLATLAHEIGHAFGLRPADNGSSGTTTWQGGGHVNPNGQALPGFNDTNIMWGGGPPTRSLLTLGQVFRMNTHDDQWGGSMLVKNNPTRPKRRCDPLWANKDCPALRVDWP